MKEWKQSLLRVQEDGMEAIEGLLVITLMLFVLFFIWGYGFLLFQQFVVIRAADETANKIAQTYAYAETDPITGYISKEVKVALSPSRYQSGKLQEKNEQRAIKYGKWLVRKGSLATQVGMPVVEAKTVYDGVAQRHVVVNITAEYRIPFGNFLELFRVSGTRVYHATGRAMCTDLSHYINTVDYTKTLNYVVGNVAKNDYVDLLEKVLAFIVKKKDL